MERETRNQLRRLAESQRGLFSAAQAAQLGVSYNWLYRAVSEGHLRRSRHGVYVIAGTPASRWEPIVAAALSAGPEAVVSHSTAASAHRLLCASPVPSVIELSVPRQARNRPLGVRVHARSLPKEDVVRKHGVQITSAARTLVDIAGRLDRSLLERTIDEGILRHSWSVPQLWGCLERAPSNFAGRARVRALLDQRREPPNADSVLEIRAFSALRPLRPFVAHYLLAVDHKDYVIDAAWPAQRVGAEIIGRAHRVASKSAFDRERLKLNALMTAGWRVVHLTAAMSDRDMVIAVRRLLVATAEPSDVAL